MNAPVHLGQMVADKESEMSGANSIWIQKVDDATVRLQKIANTAAILYQADIS